jgi:hypothetical protein
MMLELSTVARSMEGRAEKLLYAASRVWRVLFLENLENDHQIVPSVCVAMF